MSPSRRIRDEGTQKRVWRGWSRQPDAQVRSGLLSAGSLRLEAATYLGISASKFDELRKANRIAPPKVLDGRLIFTVERLDEFLDFLPDENQAD